MTPDWQSARTEDNGATLPLGTGSRYVTAQKGSLMGTCNSDCPSDRAVTSHHRPAGLKFLLCALALLLGAAVSRGQWLETKIVLPDSLGGATGPTALTTDSSERYVYISDAGGSVYIVDAEAGLRVAKVSTDPSSSVCSNPRRDKVYAPNCIRNDVTVISCATNQAVATVPVGTRPVALCYNSHDDKVCCANYDSDDLTVIDCASDSATKTVHVGEEPSALCYNPASNRVFCVVSDTVAVLDGASDTVVALIEATVGGWGSRMSVNPAGNRVYATGGSGVLGLDGTTGVVLDSIGSGPVAGMSCNPTTNRLYIGGSSRGRVLIIDCAADTFIDQVDVGQFVSSVACDTATNRVYVARSHPAVQAYEVVVIDGITNNITARIPAGCDFGELLGSSRRGRMYCTGRDGTDLSVIDVGSDSLLRTVMIGGSSNLMCYDATDDKVYYVAGGPFGEAGAIDAATNLLVAHVPVGRFPAAVVWHAPNDRVYCCNNASSDITVIDAQADTMAKTIAVSPHPTALCSAPRVNKVYCYCAMRKLAVLDCTNDSVIKTIPIPTAEVFSMCYVSTASYDKLYIGGMSAVSIIDCVGDSLIRSYPFHSTILAPNPDGKRVYCRRGLSLCTFDTEGDTLVADVPWEAEGGTALLYVPGVEKVYCACGAWFQNYVLVADALTDSVITQIPIIGPTSLGYDSITGLVYCGRLDSGKVMLIDCRTDSIVDSLSPCIYPESFTMVPVHSRVYVGNAGNSFIPVIRTDPPGVEEPALSHAQKKSAGPTIVSRNSPLVIHQPSVLLDATGRKLCDMNPGRHDLTRYRAGVYFLRSCTGEPVVKLLLVQ